jgi:translation initiation factor IF-2
MFLQFVQHGTLKVGDYMLAGKHHGKIKAMHMKEGNIVTVGVFHSGICFRFRWSSNW